MRNFKDIILEKLKVTKNTVKLPDLEDFKDVIYNLNISHEISFEDVDLKYKEIKNCPQYENNGKLWYIYAIYVSKRMNSDKYLYAFCSDGVSATIENFMITSMNQLVELLGEELVLQIWDYIK